MSRLTRRALLSTLPAATLALAGCVDGTDSDSNGASDDGTEASGDSAGAETTAASGTGMQATGTRTSNGETTIRETATPTGLRLDSYDVEGSPGETVTVQPSDSVVLLDFFATWCAPCKPQMESLRNVHEQFPDVHMLSITWEGDDAAISDFWQEYEGTWPVASDTENRTGPKYGVDRIPTLIVFDAEGTEIWRHVGLASEDDIVESLEKAGAA
jgi:thiol-disulfide isomerase/thioredoxin